ncbi:MAG: nitronate monooxygenase family protein [Actinobacteria bacterium]|nr:nitronate monooxygenase family protein [Actinomycetota bacterium]MBU1493784.1 nitronate monooxygenase family protein [Actinomycetota bacterium]MBU1865888.1 nitronate monooxygenase family protein [Actinomycetota bacterium]
MFRTRITDLYGVEHPIVQGGLQVVGVAELTAAVANAGAMGFMTALSYETPEDLRRAIAKCRGLTDRPFGVNITLLPALHPPDYPGYLRVCAEEGIEFLETAGRSPEPFMPVVEEAGIKVTHKCTSIRHALKAQSVGVHAVSIDGFECAGHPGEDDVTSLILVPLAADALDIPVIASGGFGDGRGLVAALALGAEGINMGTRFVATAEAPVHPAAKQAMVDHNELDTTLVMRTLRNTARVLANATARKVVEIESRPGDTDIADLIPYVAGSESRGRVWGEGDIDAGIVAAGQVMGLIRDIPTVGELIRRIIAEAEAIVAGRLPGMTIG